MNEIQQLRDQLVAITHELSVIKGNHLAHMEQAMTSLATDVRVITSDHADMKISLTATTTNIGWIMKIGGCAGTIILTALVALWFKSSGS